MNKKMKNIYILAAALAVVSPAAMAQKRCTVQCRESGL